MNRNTSFSSRPSNGDDDGDAVFGEDGAEQEQQNLEFEPDHPLIIDKILGRKFMEDDNGETLPWFLIKWRGKSYIHASWERQSDLEVVDPNGKSKIKRFLQQSFLPPAILGLTKEEIAKSKEADNEDDEDSEPEPDEIEYFHPDMADVQRIIACDTPGVSHASASSVEDIESPKTPRKRKIDDDDIDENEVQYFVKWKGCSYDECSWEKWSDIKFASKEVFQFWKIQKPPTQLAPSNSNPSLQEYKKFNVSPVFGDVAHNVGGEVDESVDGLRLRDYQLEGLNWLLWNWWHKRSCILADEMGLGKTIQTIAFLHQLRFTKTTSINGPFLIIAPLSLVDQWQSEIATWSPSMNTVLLHGNQQARETIVGREFYYQEPYVSKAEASALKRAGVFKFQILLTTFENAVKEISTLCKVPWEAMIIDEAHKLKNAQSRIFQTLSNIKTKHCVLLTGTPLQNKTEELWALLNFAEPDRFNDLGDFLTKFGDLKSAHQVASLHEMLKPYLLRRIKEDVEKSLPPKEETIVEVALTSIQKRFYRAIYEKNTSFLFKGVRNSNQPSLMNVMMELRKCCNHPYLVRGVEERIHDELTPEEAADPDITSKKLVDSCGKLVLLDKLLPRLHSQGHKVLIFSQMVRVLNLLEDYLRHKEYSFERLDGSTRSSDRKEAVERFCKPSLNRFIMLLSTKAGGLGLNLTAADTVIIYDSDWNPQNDLQAQARAHRIGQKKAVMVYRLLTRKTYEMEMFHQASMKLGLDRAVLAHARQEKSSDKESKYKLSAKEIDELLKKGAYDVFREDDTEQNEFVEADIDSILQRRSHKLVYDGAKSNTASLGTFSKASFVSADEKEDVDINDPDFWKKAIGLTENPGGVLYEPEVVEELPLVRIRKQVKGYNDEPLYTDDQLNEYLKPISQTKLDKQARQEAAEKKRQEKEELRLQQLREKQEKEEARRLKVLEEARVRADPKFWGSHGRDRLLRALLAFGFGRWDRIRGETGKPAMDLGDLESFCRWFIVQCGIVIINDKNLRNEPRCVFEAIETAKALLEEEKLGTRKIEMPAILAEDRFAAKLRNTGMAKKSLGKLDILSKLLAIIRETLATLCKSVDVDVDPNEDIDRIFNSFTIEEIAAILPLGDIRPSWTRSCPWWDYDCDRHLLLGVFRHGMGRYDLLRKDKDLVFGQKIQAFLDSKNPGAAKSRENGDDAACQENKTGGSEVVMERNSISPAAPSEIGEEGGAAPLGSAPSAANLQGLGGNENEDGNDFDDAGDAADDDEKAGAGGAAAGTGLSGEDMPDPRHLNRLLNWLVTSEQARLFEADIIPVVPEKRERKTRSDKKEKPDKFSNLARMDRNEEAPFYASFTSIPVSLHSHMDEDGQSEIFRDRSKLQLDRLPETELSRSEHQIVGWLRHLLDVDSIAMSLKSQIAGLKKCESILASAILTANDRNSWKRPASKPKAQRSLDDSSMDVDETSPALSSENGEIDNRMKEDEEDGDAGEEDFTLTENEAVTLAATLILFGAPSIPYMSPATSALLKDWMGFKVTDESFNHDATTQFTWEALASYCELHLPAHVIETFYTQIWLPFCHQIIRRKSLSISPNKFVVPNPLINLNEHHLGAKGLCQIFVIRQHILRAISFLLNCYATKLVEYLRSPAGRSVDNMPIWWCPWIHDLGVLMGVIKHGFMKLDGIVADPELPFHPKHLEAFIRKVFITGNTSMPALARFDLSSVDEVDDFVHFTLMQFPEPKDLEMRVFRIVDEVTRGLPDDHYARLPVNAAQYRSFFAAQLSSGTNEDVNQSGMVGPDGNVVKKGDGRGTRTTARPPTMSLKSFVHTSRKRRKLYVTSYHPEAFSVESSKLG